MLLDHGAVQPSVATPYVWIHHETRVVFTLHWSLGDACSLHGLRLRVCRIRTGVQSQVTASDPQASEPASLGLTLEGELTIGRAAELKEALLVWLDEHVGLELDLSKVTELDTAGVQLLLLTKQTADATGKVLRLVEQSLAVREVFELLHLAGHFGAPSTTPAASENPA